MFDAATRGSDDAARLALKPLGERRAAIQKLSKKTGLDRTEVEAFLTREGPLGQLSGGDRDAVIWRFMAAWDGNDAQGMVDLFLWEHGVPFINKGQLRDHISELMRKEKAVGVFLSDLADGATFSRASGSFKHLASYYKQWPDGRATEIFANVVSLAGESEMGARMVERLFPACPYSNKWDRCLVLLRECFAHHFHITRGVVDSANGVSRWSLVGACLCWRVLIVNRRAKMTHLRG